MVKRKGLAICVGIISKKKGFDPEELKKNILITYSKKMVREIIDFLPFWGEVPNGVLGLAILVKIYGIFNIPKSEFIKTLKKIKVKRNKVPRKGEIREFYKKFFAWRDDPLIRFVSIRRIFEIKDDIESEVFELTSKNLLISIARNSDVIIKVDDSVCFKSFCVIMFILGKSSRDEVLRYCKEKDNNQTDVWAFFSKWAPVYSKIKTKEAEIQEMRSEMCPQNKLKYPSRGAKSDGWIARKTTSKNIDDSFLRILFLERLSLKGFTKIALRGYKLKQVIRLRVNDVVFCLRGGLVLKIQLANGDFVRECKFLERLKDFEYCQKLVDHWSDSGFGYIVTKRLEKGEIICEDVEEILKGLEKEYGVLHVDVHSGNVMCNKKGENVLIDFGWAVEQGGDFSEHPLVKNGYFKKVPSFTDLKEVQEKNFKRLCKKKSTK